MVKRVFLCRVCREAHEAPTGGRLDHIPLPATLYRGGGARVARSPPVVAHTRLQAGGGRRAVTLLINKNRVEGLEVGQSHGAHGGH